MKYEYVTESAAENKKAGQCFVLLRLKFNSIIRK